MTSTATTDRYGLFRVIATIVVAALVMAGCTTTRPTDPGAPASLADEIKAGDRVKVTTRDGQTHEFQVVTAEPDALVGAEQRVARDEIVQLEVMETSVAKAAGVVLGLCVFLLVTSGAPLTMIAPVLLAGG